MFDTQDFQPTDAIEANIGCSTLAPGAIDATVDQPLQFPCTLKQVADSLGVSYSTLRNKWIQKIESIYEGYQPVRNSRKFVTAFGFSAIENYISQVVNGRIGFEEYAENERKIHNIIQAQYVENIDKAENDPGINQIDHDASNLFPELFEGEILDPGEPLSTSSALATREVTSLTSLEEQHLQVSEATTKLLSQLERIKQAARHSTLQYQEQLQTQIDDQNVVLAALTETETELQAQIEIQKQLEIKTRVQSELVNHAQTQVKNKVVSLRDFTNRRSGKSG